MRFEALFQLIVYCSLSLGGMQGQHSKIKIKWSYLNWFISFFQDSQLILENKMYELYYLLLCTNNKKLNLGQFFSFLHLLSFFFPGPLVSRVMTREVVPYNRQNMETFKFWLFMYVPVWGNLSIKITSKNKLNFLITSILSCLLARRRGR